MRYSNCMTMHALHGLFPPSTVVVSVPAALTVPESATLQVCAKLSGGTTSTTIGSRLTALLNTSERLIFLKDS